MRTSTTCTWECENGSGRLTRLHAPVGERWLVSAARWARVSEAMKLRQASRAFDARPSVAVSDVSDDTKVASLTKRIEKAELDKRKAEEEKRRQTPYGGQGEILMTPRGGTRQADMA